MLLRSVEQSSAFAQAWIAAWNSHDLEEILTHYTEDVRFCSPLMARIAGNSSGVLEGREALRNYFRAALETFPSLTFRLRAVFTGVESVTIVYDSVKGLVAAETMVLDESCRATSVLAQYDRVG
jgi:ketosteroid isomerase-like protein